MSMLLMFGGYALDLWAKLPWQMKLAFACVIMLVIAALYLMHTSYNKGHQEAIIQIEDANHAASEKADGASKTVDQCYATGGTWDRSSGVCRDAPGR